MIHFFRALFGGIILFSVSGCAHVAAPSATVEAPRATSPRPSASPLYISYFEFLPKKDVPEFQGYFIITDKADTPQTSPNTFEFTLTDTEGNELARVQRAVQSNDYTPYRSRISGEEIGPAFVWTTPYDDVKRTKRTHAVALLRITLVDGTTIEEQRYIRLPEELRS